MADGRFLSRSIAQSEQLGRVSLEAALLFTWCIPFLDVEGRMTGNPSLIKAAACPLRPEIAVLRIPELLRELVRERLVIWYEVAGKQCLAFPGFERHQRGLRKRREAPSKIPSSTDSAACVLAGADPAQVRLFAGLRPPEVEGEVEVEPEAEAERATAGVTPAALPDYATACCVAVNQGLECLLAGAYRPLVDAVEAPIAASWANDGIPLDLATRILAERTAAFRSTRFNRQPNTLRYFDGAVREAWAKAQSRTSPAVLLTPAERMLAAAAKLEREGAA